MGELLEDEAKCDVLAHMERFVGGFEKGVEGRVSLVVLLDVLELVPLEDASVVSSTLVVDVHAVAANSKANEAV